MSDATVAQRCSACLIRAFEASVVERIPSGRIGVPDDCAGAALLLCSAAGSYINGAVLAVDGGMRL